MTEDEITRMQCWSSAGGRHDALRRVAAMIRTDAGEAFAAKRNDEAMTMRAVAVKVDAMVATAATELQAYIDGRDRTIPTREGQEQGT